MIIDRAYIDIDGTEHECKNISVKTSTGAKPVKTMNRENRSRGSAAGQPEFSISCEIPMKDDDDVDFEQMALDREEFSTTVEYEGGEVRVYQDSFIADVEIASSDGEETTYKLEITALDRS